MTELFVVAAVLVWNAPSQAPQTEVVAEVRIQGNVATPDEEVLRLAGITLGMPVEPDTPSVVAERLRATKRFERVEVRKRYASIADPSRIVLVVLVDEGPVAIERTGDPARPTRVVRRRRLNLLFLPLVTGEDGYGLTYGVRLAAPDRLGPDSRVSFPMTWGGEKRAAVEVEKRFERRLLTRIEGGGSVSRRTHPFFESDDDRRALWLRGERRLTEAWRVGASAGFQRVSFRDSIDRVTNVGADAVLDTRLDPFLARNAVYTRAAWDHFEFHDGGATNRLQVDGIGYVGLFGQTILVTRALSDRSDGPLPEYLKPILGGQPNLRGFRAGTAVGDTLLAGSAELRVPLTSPLRVGKIGVSAFVDAATVYDRPGRLGDQPMKKGIGGGVWFAAAFLRLNVDVAHGIGASTRVHASGNVTF